MQQNHHHHFQHELHTQKLQALGQLAGGVAHDFNNILSVIEGYARMIERQLGREHPMHDKVDHILTATKRGASLTRRLLAFGRQQILPEASCDIAQVIRDNEVLLQPLLTRRIHIALPATRELFYVPCDDDTLSQIIINLAVNARDAMPDGGTITMNLSGDADTVTLRFADTGFGIPPYVLPKIFDPFFTTKEQGKGTGLGLSMVSGFMRQIEGDIRVTSETNKGTIFTLIFPRAQTKNKFADDKKDSHTGYSLLRDKTVLVVDDEEQLLPLVEAQLQDLGMKVLKAANADTALILQEDYRDKIDLLLTDVVMPGLNGVRLSELLQSLRPDIGVVYMTGYANRADTETHMSPLPRDALVIPKPLQPDSISPALLAALQRVHDM